MWQDFSQEVTDDEELLEVLDVVYPESQVKRKRYRPNHMYIWNDKEFLDRFRISKDACINVLNKIIEDISNPTDRNYAVSPITMLLLTLRYYAPGSMLIVVGDFCGIHNSTASKIIKKVSEKIAKLKPQYIYLPQTEDEIKLICAKFYKVAKFSKCIGAIDCTHVKIQSPGGNNVEVYRNRKGFFSFNVQAICDPTLKIMNLVARWPGSSPDSTIFNNSRIKAQLENGLLGDKLIVGDGGYAVKPYLIAPLRNPITPAEILFNESQIRTRNPIERCFGIWKMRFPILALGIRVKYTLVQAIVVATAVLHNIAIDVNVLQPEINEDVEQAIDLSNNFLQSNNNG